MRMVYGPSLRNSRQEAHLLRASSLFSRVLGLLGIQGRTQDLKVVLRGWVESSTLVGQADRLPNSI